MVSAISQVGAGANVAKTQAASGEASFARVLSAADATAKTESEVRKAAQQLVASTFVLPLLKQVRNDPFKNELFHGGSAEETWGAQLDTTIADRITARSNFPMVDAVYRSIMANANREVRGTQGSLRTPASKDGEATSSEGETKRKVNVNG